MREGSLQLRGEVSVQGLLRRQEIVRLDERAWVADAVCLAKADTRGAATQTGAQLFFPRREDESRGKREDNTHLVRALRI